MPKRKLLRAKNAAADVTPAKKVFDVMRPGKSLASSNSRSVITGHKPQAPDPFLAQPSQLEESRRALLDSSKKVTVEPADSIDTSSETNDQDKPVPTLTTSQEKPVAVPENSVPAPVSADLSQPSLTVPASPVTPTLSETTPASDATATAEPTPANTDAVPASPAPVENGDLSANDLASLALQGQVAPPHESAPAAQSEAAKTPTTPQIPDGPLSSDPAPGTVSTPVAQVFVSHHNHGAHWGMKLLVFVVIVLFLALALDILLDLKVLSLNLPHTHLLHAI